MQPGKTNRNFDMGSQLFPVVTMKMVSCICCSLCFTVFFSGYIILSGVRFEISVKMCVAMSPYSTFVLSVVKCFMLNRSKVASLLFTPTPCS